MYKLFENHVYTAHSVVARKVLDKDKVDVRKSSGSTTTTSNSTGTLRINDEITIIPQSTRHDSSDQNTCRPARTGEKRSRVDIIDLSDDEDKKESRALPKSQVTITKVPAPKGSYLSKNSLRESASKRSRADGNDTEWIICPFVCSFVVFIFRDIAVALIPQYVEDFHMKMIFLFSIFVYERISNLMKQNSETIQVYSHFRWSQTGNVLAFPLNAYMT